MGRFSWIIQWALNATGKVLIRGRQREMGQQNQDTVLLPLKTGEGDLWPSNASNAAPEEGKAGTQVLLWGLPKSL